MCIYIYMYIYIYNIYIYYICIYCISSNWHRISLWIEGDRGRPPFGTTFQKWPLLLSVPPLFSPSVKINLPYFFFMFLLFLHGRRRHWKKGTAHREILQKFLLRFAYSGAYIKTYLKNHISLLYLPKIMSLPLVPPFLSNMPKFNFALSPFRCGLFSPFLQTLVRKSKLLGLK